MKKLITLICALVIGTMSFAQKNEIKAIEKALKSNNFAVAKTNVAAAESLLANMDDKMKDKFYFLKAKSLFSNGAIANGDIDAALEAITNLINLKEKTGKSKYFAETLSIKDKILASIVQSAFDASKKGINDVAGDKFYRAYTLSPKDTLYLYAAASSYLNAQKYDESLKHYEKLLEMDYKGVVVEYVATNKDTGVEEVFNNKDIRDASVKSKQFIAPKERKLPSKKGEILRYMALIYSNKDNTEKALDLISQAKQFNPNDMQLVIAEAKAYLASDQKDKVKPLLESANKLIEGNDLNLTNFGIFAMEIGENEMAQKYFNDALKINPNRYEAHLNMGALILNEDKTIVDEMNSLGNSSTDNARYDTLRDKRVEVYKKAIPFIEKAFELNPDISTAKYLRDLYSTAFLTDKYKEMKQKIADMEAAGN